MTQHFLCKQQDLTEDKARGFTIGQKPENLELLLVKKDGQIYAYKNHCPHLGITLNWQEDEFLSLEKTHIECSTHGALFNLGDGHCIAGPCIRQDLQPLTIELRDDEVWLQI